MRRVFALPAVILAASCGGSATAPSTNPPMQPVALANGAYVLTLAMSTSGNSGYSACVSLTIGGEPPAFTGVFVPTPVQVSRIGDTITITPDDPSATFRMQLQQAGASLSGTAAGQFQSASTVVTVSGRSPGTAAAATGIVVPVGPPVASGGIDGMITVQGLSCTNNGHAWTLAPPR